MAIFRKVNWLGGMNSQLDPVKRGFDEGYWLGINVRTRTNTAASVRAPLDITTGLPGGLAIQGLYAFDRSLLAFAGGSAFYKLNSTAPWLQISGFAMSSTAPEIDCESIPASTVNFIRSATSGQSQASNAVVLGSPTPASPAALIVMDGETQPRLIFPNATTRVTQTYAQWTSSNAEYVPIARYPRYVDGILYCVGKDLAGNLTQIYRSVSGRPTDFVILIDQAGNKIDGSEAVGGAPVLATRVSYAPMTALAAGNFGQAGLIASTATGTWAVIPDYDITIAAEPTFSHVPMMDIGAVGKNSIVDVLGDTTVVCRAGIRSFNGVRATRWEGKNAPFSAAINNFISANEQTVTAAGLFDNYALYALSTTFGPGIAVYDMLQGRWVSIDIYPGVGLIKQFATVQSGVTEELFFYTANNRIYKAFAGSALTASVFLNELAPSGATNVHSITAISASFSNVRTAGYSQAYCAIDRIVVPSTALAVPTTGTVTTQPTDIPFNSPVNDDQVVACDFSFQPGNRNGFRAMGGMQWTAEAELVDMDIVTDEKVAAVKNTQISTSIPFVHLIHIANDYGVGTNKSNLHTMITRVQGVNAYIGSGNHATQPGAAFDIATSVQPYWDGLKSVGKFYATPGPNELVSTNALPFYAYLRQGPDHWSKLSFSPALDVFFLQAGIGAAQWLWLSQQVAASTATYKVVCISSTVASSVSGAVIEAFDYKGAGVTAILTAAGNIYERLVMPDGLTVINNGVGGGATIPATLPSTLNANSKRAINALGYVTIQATPLRLTITFTTYDSQYVVDTTNL